MPELTSFILAAAVAVGVVVGLVCLDQKFDFLRTRRRKSKNKVWAAVRASWTDQIGPLDRG